MDEKIVSLYSDYIRGSLARREFLKKLSALAGGTAAANALLPLLEQSHASAEVVAQNDPRLRTDEVQYPGATGDVRAYWARPKGEGKLPGVIIVHENRGLVPHIEDVTRRVALEGFVVMAPDALSPLGRTPADPATAPAMIQTLDPQATAQNYLAAVKYLMSSPACTTRVGVVGFCWGGGMANQLAVHSPELSAVVPFYGMPPAPEEVPQIKASLLLHYAGLDERINRGIPAYEAALKRASVDYRLYMYEGAKHGFFNDSNPERYNQEAARLAWERTISFLKEKLQE